MLDDLLKNALNDKLPAWTSMLTERAGFQADQAKTFLPAVIKKVSGLFSDGKLDVSKGFDAQKILGALDLTALGKKAGVSADQAKTGLQAVLPELTTTLNEKVGEAGGLLEALKDPKGGVLGKLGGLMG